MAAALATLTVADRDEGLIAHLQRMGSRLRQGIAEQAAALGVSVRQSGPAQMPLILFDDDPNFEKGNAFCAVALQRRCTCIRGTKRSCAGRMGRGRLIGRSRRQRGRLKL